MARKKVRIIKLERNFSYLKNENKIHKIDLEKLKNNRPSPFVARDKIEEFKKGIYKSSSLSTFDASGDGIKRRFKLGRKKYFT